MIWQSKEQSQIGVIMDIELVCCTEVLLRNIADKHFKRKNIATVYAFAIKSSEPTDWETVNKAIINRWSESGLDYTKRLAWKDVESNHKKG